MRIVRRIWQRFIGRFSAERMVILAMTKLAHGNSQYEWVAAIKTGQGDISMISHGTTLGYGDMSLSDWAKRPLP